MSAIRTFTVPLVQTPFASAELEHVKIDLAARTVTGFIRYLDANGHALKSDAFSTSFDALSGPAKTAGKNFILATIAAIAPAPGTDSVG